MAGGNLNRSEDYGNRLFIDGGDLSGTVTSDTFVTRGYNHLSLLFEYTYDAATQLQVFVDTSHNGTTWFETPEENTFAPPVVTLGEREYRRSTNASSFNFTIPVPILASYARVRVTSTSGTSDDTIDMRVHLGAL